jgi:hypothetical protein
MTQKDFFTQHSGYGRPDVKRIFIVGMPRSGTSLIEQILASHPDVFGAGELIVMQNIYEHFFNDNEAIRPINGHSINLQADYYTDFTADLAQNKPVVTDKMPYNMYHLWLIALMFPDARIIYCKRDPMDNCFSCYTTNFTDKHEFTDNLDDLGAFYRLHQKLMAHWKKVLPLPIFEISYEDMVGHTNEKIGELLEFCGLSWNEQCVKFYETDRPVFTASRTQVKKQIYATSIQRWKKYEEFLDPLKAALEEYRIKYNVAE